MKPTSSPRIVVIGTSGCGKSTLARTIAAQWSVPHIELDALYWGPNWTEVPISVFMERVKEAISTGGWVVDGNYGQSRDYIWKKATTVIWLDYSFTTIFWRALLRSIRRSLTGEYLWSGNKESFRRTFFHKDSILLWVLKTFRLRRRQYTEQLKRPEYAHLKVLRFTSPRLARRKNGGKEIDADLATNP